MVETNYGPGTMHIVILRLQREVDIQSSILLNEFKEARQIDRKIEEIKKDKEQSFQKSGSSTLVSSTSLDPREIDQILREIASICQKAHLFDRFLRVRASDKVEVLNSEFLKNPRAVPPPKDDEMLQQTSKLNEIIQGISF